MKVIKVLALTLGLLQLTACATSAKYSAIVDSWTGSHIDKLVASWGYPTNSFEAPNGNKVYVYSTSRSVTLPTTAQTTYYGNTANTYINGGQTIGLTCETFFEVDKDQKIVTWRWRGNDCKST